MLGMGLNTSGHGQADFCPFGYSQNARMMRVSDPWELYCVSAAFKNVPSTGLLHIKSITVMTGLQEVNIGSPAPCWTWEIK